MLSDEMAVEIRKCIIRTAHGSQVPHVGSSLSCVDILSVLYFEHLRLDPWHGRDIFIMSKAHAAMALYSTLAVKGMIQECILSGYCKNEGTLPAHLDRFSDAPVEASAGSLGHGFNIGLGMAFGLKQQAGNRQVYVLIGDGESQEGSIWEGALFAGKLGLSNFTAVMDYNNLQGYGRARDLCNIDPVREKWEAFGWHAQDIDGHDHQAIRKALTTDSGGKPKFIVARTIKGKGVSFMEDQLIWHYYLVTDDLKEKALKELQ